jgi:hypothetical protein
LILENCERPRFKAPSTETSTKVSGELHGNFARKGLPKQRAEATPSREDSVKINETP